MKRFVEDFWANTSSQIANEINDYAERHNLNIIQISLSAPGHTAYRALVLFERMQVMYMTDKDVYKGLKCLNSSQVSCMVCPYIYLEYPQCKQKVKKDAADLANHQRRL